MLLTFNEIFYNYNFKILQFNKNKKGKNMPFYFTQIMFKNHCFLLILFL